MLSSGHLVGPLKDMLRVFLHSISKISSSTSSLLDGSLEKIGVFF